MLAPRHSGCTQGKQRLGIVPQSAPRLVRSWPHATSWPVLMPLACPTGTKCMSCREEFALPAWLAKLCCTPFMPPVKTVSLSAMVLPIFFAIAESKGSAHGDRACLDGVD